MEKRAGHPFYLAVQKDAVFALVLFLAIGVLALVVGSPLEPPADPNATSYVPRPDWYFLDFFQLLWYLKGRWEPLWIFLIVTGVVVVLLLLPFYDYRPERHPLRRPVATTCAGVAVIAVLGLTYLGMRAPVPAGRAEAPTVGGAVNAGARLFRVQGCADCHMIAGVGIDFGPELTHVGGRLSRAQMETTIIQGKGAMPAFPGLISTDLTTLLDYLQSLK